MNVERLPRVWNVLLVLAALATAVVVGTRISGLVTTVSAWRTGMLIPFAALAAAIMWLAGQEVILYLLAVAWVIPVITAGLGAVPFTREMTAWELLLYVGVAVAIASGQIRLPRRFGNNDGREKGIANGVWAGLLLVSVGSLLAIDGINIFGYGNFRYAAIDPLLLFLLSTCLIKRREQLLKFAFFACAGFAVLLFVQVIPGFDLDRGRLEVEFTSAFGGSGIAYFNRTALWVNTGMPLALCYALGAEKRALRWLGLLLYIALAMALVLTFSRGNIAAGLMGSVVVLLLASRAGHGRQVIMLIGFLALGMLIAAGYLPYLFSDLDKATLDSLAYRIRSVTNLDLLARDENVLGRLDLWRLSWALLRDKPFGIGYGTIPFITGSWEHNMFVLVMNGAGLIGLLGLLIFLGSYALACLHALERTDGFMRLLCTAALGGLVTTVFNGLSMEILAPGYAEPVLLILALGLGALKLSLEPVHVNAQVVLSNDEKLRHWTASSSTPHVR